MESGLRPYEKRALSISSQHPRMNIMPSVVDAQLRLQFLGRDEMLPSVMASDPAHDPNTFPVIVEALKKPPVLSTNNPAFRAVQKQREHERLVSNLLTSRLTGKRNAPRTSRK
jgi:hypothetical protein